MASLHGSSVAYRGTRRSAPCHAARRSELNPVRLSLVFVAWEYPWSSARFHMRIAEYDSLVTDRVILGRVTDRQRFLRSEEYDPLKNRTGSHCMHLTRLLCDEWQGCELRHSERNEVHGHVSGKTRVHRVDVQHRNSFTEIYILQTYPEEIEVCDAHEGNRPVREIREDEPTSRPYV